MLIEIFLYLQYSHYKFLYKCIADNYHTVHQQTQISAASKLPLFPSRKDQIFSYVYKYLSLNISKCPSPGGMKTAQFRHPPFTYIFLFFSPQKIPNTFLPRQMKETSGSEDLQKILYNKIQSLKFRHLGGFQLMEPRKKIRQINIAVLQ